MSAVLVHDDQGQPVPLAAGDGGVVSIVPSLTETLAAAVGDRLLAATRYCTEPPGLDVARVGGTKNPDLAAIIALRPALVLANEEENRAVDVAALRAAGLAVYVTVVRSVPEALDSLGRLHDALGVAEPGWLAQARTAWAGPPPPEQARAVVPIWRRPWMALGRDTFAGDVLSRLGIGNVLAESSERYPRFEPGGCGPLDFVVLPDEPYPFSPTDGPEAFPGVPARCVSGRHLTWYGPSLVEAGALLRRQLALG